MGFEVITQDIRDAARKAAAAANGVGRADPSDDVDGISTALPGSQSAGAAERLSTAWGDRFRGWKADALDLQERCNAGADAYDASDHAAALRARPFPG